MTLVTVLSASGRPGLAQVRQLLNAGYQVRATTRNPETMKHFENTSDGRQPLTTETLAIQNKTYKCKVRFLN